MFYLKKNRTNSFTARSPGSRRGATRTLKPPAITARMAAAMTGSVSTIIFPLYPSLGLLAVSSDAGVQGSVWSGERTIAVFTVPLVLSTGYESAIARVSCCIYAFLAILDCGRVLGFTVVIMWCSWDGVGTGHVRIRRWNRGTE